MILSASSLIATDWQRRARRSREKTPASGRGLFVIPRISQDDRPLADRISPRNRMPAQACNSLVGFVRPAYGRTDSVAGSIQRCNNVENNHEIDGRRVDRGCRAVVCEYRFGGAGWRRAGDQECSHEQYRECAMARQGLGLGPGMGLGPRWRSRRRRDHRRRARGALLLWRRVLRWPVLLWRGHVLRGPRVRSGARLLRGGRWWRRRGVLHASLQVLRSAQRHLLRLRRAASS